MRFTVEKASDWSNKREVEINSIEDIKNLPERYEKPLPWNRCLTSPYEVIINFERNTIVIYNSYLE